MTSAIEIHTHLLELQAERAELEQRLPADSFALATNARQWIEDATAVV